MSSVVLADEHTVARDGLRRVLEEAGDIRIIGEAPAGLEAVAVVERLHPTVVLIDISMLALSGLEATGQIRARDTLSAVVFLTMDESEVFPRGDALWSAGLRPEVRSMLRSREDAGQPDDAITTSRVDCF